MDVLTSPRRTPAELIDRLHLFTTQVIDHPSRRETVATWRQIEAQLPLELQTRILLAWNKHLADVNDSDEINAAVRDVISELR